MVDINNSIFVLGGGGYGGSGFNARSEILKLVCQNERIENCRWQEEIALKFENGRIGTVSIPLPESYDIACE